MTIESGTDLTLSAKGLITLDAGRGVDIKAGMRFKVSALTQVAVNTMTFNTTTPPLLNPVAAAAPLI